MLSTLVFTSLCLALVRSCAVIPGSSSVIQAQISNFNIPGLFAVKINGTDTSETLYTAKYYTMTLAQSAQEAKANIAEFAKNLITNSLYRHSTALGIPVTTIDTITQNLTVAVNSYSPLYCTNFLGMNYTASDLYTTSYPFCISGNDRLSIASICTVPSTATTPCTTGDMTAYQTVNLYVTVQNVVLGTSTSIWNTLGTYMVEDAKNYLAYGSAFDDAFVVFTSTGK